MNHSLLIQRASGAILRVSLCCLLLTATGAHAQAEPLEGFATLWTGNEIDLRTGDVSPDGRVLSDINWDTGDLDLIDLDRKVRTPLTGEGYGAGRYAWKSAFSKDGRRIAVAWYRYDTGRHELRVHDRDGSGSRVLSPSRSDIYALEPLDWSPDDADILVALQSSDRQWEIGLVAVEDGAYRMLKSLGWIAPGGEHSYPRAFFSPDGRQVGFDHPTEAGSASRAIHLLSLDSGEEARLLHEAAANRLLGWTADGTRLLVYSNREGVYGVWTLRKSGGCYQVDAKPLVVTPRGLVPARRTERGFIFGRTHSSTGAHSASLDPSTGQVLRPAMPLHPVDSLSSEAADFSPNGRRLAYLAHDPYPEKTERVVVRDLVSGAEQSVPVPGDIHTTRATFRWVNEHSIVLFGAERGVLGIFRFDPVNGEMSRLPERAVSTLGFFKWFEVAPDGKRLFGAPRDPDGSRLITAIDVETGEATPLVRANTDQRSLSVSPDGAWLAYLDVDEAGRHQLRVTPSAGDGASRLVFNASEGERLRSPVAWTADGAHLYFLVDETLHSIAVTGERASVKSYGSGWCCIGHEMNVHPEGQQLLFLSGVNETSILALAMPNAVPDPELGATVRQ